MANITATISLDNIVKELLWKAELPESKERLFFQLAIRAYQEMRLFDIEEGVEVSKETINTNTDSLDMPDSCLKVIDVYVPLSGKLWALSLDPSIITTTSSGTLDPDWGEGVDIGQSTSYSYSASGGSNQEGYYNIDYANRVIIFRNVTATEVFLHCVSTGVDTDGSTMVLKNFRPQIEAYILKEYYAHSKPQLLQIWENKYEQERDRVRHLANMGSLDQFKDWVYRSYSSTVQR